MTPAPARALVVLLAALGLKAHAQLSPAQPAPAPPTALLPAEALPAEAPPAPPRPPEATPEPTPSAEAPSTPPPVASHPALAPALAALDPSRPAAYFEAGEIAAALAQTPTDLALARQLHLHAVEFARAAGDAPLAASACVALADLAPTRRDARWLWALAAALDPRYAGVLASTAAPNQIDPTVAANAAEAIDALRAGEGVTARRHLDSPAVRAAIDRANAELGRLGPGPILPALHANAPLWPCPECRNERTVPDRSTEPFVHRLCRTCRGDPGWSPDRHTLVGLLRLEALLLEGSPATWSAQLTTDGGTPLRDPDPAELAPTYAFAADRPYWTDQGWSDRPSSEPPPARDAESPHE